jgi:uncharacterized protein (TIGR02996 family)
MNEREIFHKAILANTKERITHLVFADWLEEQGEFFEAAIRRCDIAFYSNSEKTTVWIENKPYTFDGKKTNYIKAEVKNIEYSCFQKGIQGNYKNIFVIGEKESGISNISLYSLFWNDGVVTIEAFADNIK